MRRTAAFLAAVAAMLLVATPAAADDPIAETVSDTPLAGHGGWAAWSSADGSGRFRLTLRAPDGTIRAAPIAPSDRRFDVSLGPDARGDVVAVYARCAAGRCDLRRLNLETGRDQPLTSVSSPRYRERTPAIWRSTVAFTRRIRGCDVPYVKTLGSRRPSRRLLRRKCLRTPDGHLALRGTRLVASSVDLSRADANGSGPKVSEVRRYSTRRAGSAVLLRQGFGEESNRFGQVALDEHHVTTVRYGVRPAHAFVRVRTAGGTAAEVRAHVPLTGAFAKTSAGTSLYVEAQDGETGTCAGPPPCRVVLAPHSPFGRQVRTLAPRLTIAYAGEPRQSQPLTLRGALTRSVVQAGTILRAEPVAGVVVELKRRTREERFEDTPYRAVTAPDGRYEIVVAPPVPSEPWFTAVAATPGVPTWAGRGTVGSAAP